jgi:hypothetical protein
MMGCRQRARRSDGPVFSYLMGTMKLCTPWSRPSISRRANTTQWVALCESSERTQSGLGVSQPASQPANANLSRGICT